MIMFLYQKDIPWYYLTFLEKECMLYILYTCYLHATEYISCKIF